MLLTLLKYAPWLVAVWMVAMVVRPVLQASKTAPPDSPHAGTQPVASGPAATQSAMLAPASCRPVTTPRSLDVLKQQPLYSFTEADVDAYLGWLTAEEPVPVVRLIHLARKNIGQPYEIYLLGEWPYELHDPQPMYCLDRSDCVTFCEHMYAMALSNDWHSFFTLLQRIRYKDGRVGLLRRNHETVVDWNQNNQWLFEDITRLIGAGKHWADMTTLWNPGEFFKKFGLIAHQPQITWQDAYIPRERIHHILPELRDGDFVNVIKGNDRSQYCTHTGLIALGERGEVHLLHSAKPAVREEPLLAYVQNNTSIIGMKFLRLRDNPQRIVDAQLAPEDNAPMPPSPANADTP